MAIKSKDNGTLNWNHESSKRNVSFDYLKGIGILLMMVCHLVGEHNQIVYSFHMPLFFFLAGYFAKTQYPPQQNYSQLKKDAKRLILPFVVTMLMLCLWGGVQAVMKHDWMLSLRYPLSLLWASGDAIRSEKYGLIYAGPMWFLIALFWIREIFYYGAGWILSKTKGDEARGDKIVVGVSILISVGAMLLHPLVQPLPFCLFQGFAAIEFYAIGWYAHRHKIPMWVKVLCIVCWPLAIMWGGLELESCVYVCYPLDVLGACGAVLVLYQLCDWVSKGIQKLFPAAYTTHQTFLQWIGINSLAILCMHTFDLNSGMIYSFLCRLPFEVSAPILVVVRMMLAIGLAWLVTMLPGLRKVYR